MTQEFEQVEDLVKTRIERDQKGFCDNSYIFDAAQNIPNCSTTSTEETNVATPRSGIEWFFRYCDARFVGVFEKC